MNKEQYDPHQGNKTNLDYGLYQLCSLVQVIGADAYKWAHKPSPALSHHSPMDIIVQKEKDDRGWKIVGELISDMLTGSPG